MAPVGGYSMRNESLKRLARQKEREILKLRMQLQDKKNENKALKEYRSETGSIINNTQYRRKLQSDILSRDRLASEFSSSPRLSQKCCFWDEGRGGPDAIVPLQGQQPSSCERGNHLKAILGRDAPERWSARACAAESDEA